LTISKLTGIGIPILYIDSGCKKASHECGPIVNQFYITDCHYVQIGDHNRIFSTQDGK